MVTISQILSKATAPTFSFEFFPPKTPDGEAALRETLTDLGRLAPDFVSVTQTGGSTREYQLQITRWIKQDLGIEAMAHLTCVGATADELRASVGQLADAGIENVLALRGDVPGGGAWQGTTGGFDHAAQLAAMVRDEFGLCAGAACFPELHPDATDPLTDLRFLKQKVEAGASFLVTQLFFDNDAYFRFVDAARFAGITVPILPGIMPITNAAQIQRIAALSGASLPPGLAAELESLRERGGVGGPERSPNPAAELGVAFATLQCADLLARGAPGIHFFTLNRGAATSAILAALKIRQASYSR